MPGIPLFPGDAAVAVSVELVEALVHLLFPLGHLQFSPGRSLFLGDDAITVCVRLGWEIAVSLVHGAVVTGLLTTFTRIFCICEEGYTEECCHDERAKDGKSQQFSGVLFCGHVVCAIHLYTSYFVVFDGLYVVFMCGYFWCHFSDTDITTRELYKLFRGRFLNH